VSMIAGVSPSIFSSLLDDAVMYYMAKKTRRPCSVFGIFCTA
jgi:hypothetical protein